MKSIFFLLLFISVGTMYCQKNNCKKWKSGHFIIYNSLGNSTSISRKGNKQIEVNNITGIREELKIKWINKCTYQICRKKKDALNKRAPIELTVEVKIINSYDDHCLIFVYSNKAGDIGYYDCMYLASENNQVSP